MTGADRQPLHAPFAPRDYQDEFRAWLKTAIAQKACGRTMAVVEEGGRQRRPRSVLTRPPV